MSFWKYALDLIVSLVQDVQRAHLNLRRIYNPITCSGVNLILAARTWIFSCLILKDEVIHLSKKHNFFIS